MTTAPGARRLFAAAGLLLPLLAAASCARKPKDVKLSPARTTIYGLKRRFVMSAIVTDTKGQEIAGPVLEWSVDNPKVATIDATSGVLTTAAPGRLTVTATHATISGTAKIEVVDAATLTVAPLRMTIAGPAGTRGILHADVKSSKGKPVIDAHPRWTSSNPKVAVVDGQGVVTSVNAGRVTVSASLGEVANSADVIVSLRPVAQFEANPRTLLLRVGDTQGVTPVALDEQGKEIPDPAVEWTSSDPKVARVVDGQVTGVSAGTATVRAACGPHAAEVSVLVN